MRGRSWSALNVEQGTCDRESQVFSDRSEVPEHQEGGTEKSDVPKEVVSRWVAVGLDTAEAISFADDPSIGSPPPNRLPDQHRPPSLLEARERAGAPIPLFLHMREASGGLEAAIGRGAEGLGDVRLQGGYVVVDGADEVTPDLAARAIQEARGLA